MVIETNLSQIEQLVFPSWTHPLERQKQANKQARGNHLVCLSIRD